MKSTIYCSAIAIFVLSGCASTYQRDILESPSTELATGSTVLIATPANGSYGSQEYESSGASTVSAIRSAFARHSKSVAVSSTCAGLDCLKGGNGAYDYYVVPRILHWEERSTEWSGKPDKIEVKISVFDGTNGELLSSIVFSGKSKWATFGGDHPQDLLHEPVTSYVQSLY